MPFSFSLRLFCFTLSFFALIKGDLARTLKIMNNDTYSRRKFECGTDKIAFGIFSPDDKLTFV